MKRIHLLAAAALLAISTFHAAAVSSRPNIVFILADDLGWADVTGGHTTYGGGSDFYETPNIARLASQGLAFTSAYACQNCSPTRAALLTGQYAPRTGVYNVQDLNRCGTKTLLVGPQQNEDVPAARITLGELLKSAGYITAHFGKYHVGGHEGGAATLPQNQGFDFNYGGGAAGHPDSYFAGQTLPGVWRFGQSIGPNLGHYAQPYRREYLHSYRTWTEPAYKLPPSLLGTAKHVGDAVTDAALAFMEAHRMGDKPFYVQFHQYLVHNPTEARPDLKEKYAAKKRTAPSRMGHDNVAYAAMVEQCDQSLGRILAYLDDPNGDGDQSDSISDRTLVIFYSDNGGNNRTRNAPWRGSKGMFTEGGIRVPLVARMPGTINPGVNDTPVISVDFYKTFADFAGATLPAPSVQPLDGVSFAPLLRGTAATLPARALFWHFPGYLDTRTTPCSTLMRDINGKRLKLQYFYETQRYALYSINDDPQEENDLLASSPSREANWDVAQSMSVELRQYLDSTGAIYPKVRATGAIVPPPTPLAK